MSFPLLFYLSVSLPWKRFFPVMASQLGPHISFSLCLTLLLCVITFNI